MKQTMKLGHMVHLIQKKEAIQDALGCREWIERSLSTDNPIIYIGECELVPLRTDPDPDRIILYVMWRRHGANYRR